jgi:hypothetical protein
VCEVMFGDLEKSFGGTDGDLFEVTILALL